jgi:NAD-dependent SIR2 family protein deacetylase
VRLEPKYLITLQSYTCQVNKPEERLSSASLYALAAAQNILAGSKIAILTGAGLSTDSGIPDYRGKGKIERHPMTFDSFTSGIEARRRYWARSFVGFSRIALATPNSGHFAIAKAEQSGQVLGLITQNVDGLHQAAGSQNVLDLHGRLDRVICLDCKNVFSRDAVDEWIAKLNPDVLKDENFEYTPDGDAEVSYTDSFVVPTCIDCAGTIKPDVVFFGEQVPIDRVNWATELIDSSDALVVAGSSLAVNSGMRFVRMAHKASKPIVIVNIGPTKADELAIAKIDANTSDALEVLLRD